MPSPFPGMNPYLENPAVWADFHQTFLVYSRSSLSPQAEPSYYVQVEEHVYLHEPGEDERRFLGIADVEVTERSNDSRFSLTGGTLTAPATVTMPDLIKERRAYLQVRTRDGNKVLTVVELLSPSNKYAGDDRETYLTKRRELLNSGVNFVEIDLLRGGPQLPAYDRPECDYSVIVYRPANRPKAGFWPIRLREPLPVIPIPLRAGEHDLTLDLQAVLHRVYDESGYGYRIYQNQPLPPLSADDAAWAEQFVPARR